MRKGILLVRFFLDVLPSVRAVNKYYAQDQDDPWVQADGSYLQDNAKIDRFLEKIEPHLSFIKEILSDPSYKKKLEYYFITEENLISTLECFVKNENNRGLHQSLLDAC